MGVVRNSMSRLARITRTLAPAAFAALLGIDAGAAAPCPAGSRNAPFEYARDAPLCRVGAAEGNSVGARHGRIYNVYCPGRMTRADALRVGKALGFGSNLFAANPIPADYKNGWELTPAGPYAESDVKELGHYACGTPAGIASHFKIEYGSNGATSAKVAKHCKLVGESGAVAIGGRIRRQYRCGMHVFSTERYGDASHPVRVQDVARLLLGRDGTLASTARARGARVCLLGHGSDAPTDIECASCKSSGELVMHLRTVARGATCPTGTITAIE
jgi:hypothetical protein